MDGRIRWMNCLVVPTDCERYAGWEVPFNSCKKCPKTDNIAKIKTVKLSGIMGLHTENGGILAHRDLDHGEQ